MRKKILKILVVCTTSITLMFTLVNSKASAVNENFGSYILDDTTYEFKPYSSITTLNDLKGTFWVIGFDGYEFLQLFQNDGLVGFSVSYNAYTDVRRLPFVLQPRNLYNTENFGYEFHPNATLSLLSLSNGTSFYYSVSGLDSYIGLKLYNISNSNDILQQGYSYDTIYNLFDYYNDICRVFDIAFPNTINNITNYIGYPLLILCFPNSDDYSLSLSTYNWNFNESSFLSMFKKYSTQVTPSSFDDLLGQLEYSKGYDEGYNSGYIAGESVSNNGYRINWLTGIINAVSDILSIQVFPNVTIGYFLLVPLALGIVGMIFYFWRKD